MAANERAYRRSSRAPGGAGYHEDMNLSAPQQKVLGSVIAQVLSPEQLSRARELSRAKKPQSQQLLRWMRFNMPVAAQQVEDILYPAD